jgi:hypothetical protein
MKMALTDGSRVTEEGAEQDVHARWPWAGFPSWAEKGGFGPGADLFSFSSFLFFPFLFLNSQFKFLF